MLLYYKAPLYPEKAKLNHIQGVVVMSEVIGKDGHVKTLSVISGPEELRQAAIDAARTWRYTPYHLHGKPVEVETSINLNFNLTGQ